jgi:hypothetical protein
MQDSPCTRPRRWKWLSLLALLAFVAGGSVAYVRSLGPMPFDATRWAAPDARRGARRRMWEDLSGRMVREGWTEARVVLELGAPDTRFDSAPDEIVLRYTIGQSPHLIAQGSYVQIGVTNGAVTWTRLYPD